MSNRDQACAPPPGISVLTPSFNYSRFIEDCLSSVKHQDYPGDVEHIVMDAASEDGTVSILRNWGTSIRWASEPDKGQSDALNKALAESRNEWIGWLNADEFYLPGAFSALARALDGNPEADVVYGDCVFVDEHGDLIRLVPQHPFSRRLLRQYGPFVASCSSFIRRSVLPPQPWDVNLRMIMDWDLWLQLARNGARFLYCPQPIGAFRVHGDRVTARPVSDYSGEHETVRRRYGMRVGGRVLLRVARELGRMGHASAKLRAGSYTRQMRAMALRGADLRWFRSAESHNQADRLLGI